MAVIGFKPLANISSTNYVGKQQVYFVPSTNATNLAIGDVVIQLSTADPTAGDLTTFGRAEVGKAGATGNVLGVITEIDLNPLNLNVGGSAGLLPSTASAVWVMVDPMILLVAPVTLVGGAGGGTAPFDVTMVGMNANIIATAATQTGTMMFSNMSIDITTVTTSPAQIRIEQFIDANTALCRINQSTVTSTTGV